MSNLPKRYDRATLVKISDLYYMHRLTQQEISEIAHIHRTRNKSNSVKVNREMKALFQLLLIPKRLRLAN